MNYKYLTANTLKIIAIITMFVDHFIAIFFPTTEYTLLLRAPTRIVAPIMCFLIAEGYHYTSNKKKYMLRLFIFALISQIPFALAFLQGRSFVGNIFFGLLLGLFALTIIKSEKISIFFKIPLFLCTLITSAFMDWSYMTVLWISAFGLLRNKPKIQILSFVVIGFISLIIPSLYDYFTNYDYYSQFEIYPYLFEFGILFAIPFLLMYNGKRGNFSKSNKYFFYAFYPIHLVFLVLLYNFTNISNYFNSIF